MVDPLVRSNDEEVKRSMTFFYGKAADTKLHFKSGNSLNINKAMLCFHSPELEKMFFDKKTDMYIDDFDSETFKIFLDCLFEFKPYTVSDSLLIFPIAHKFSVKKSINLCKQALLPSVMNRSVCHTLNLSLAYKCDDLTLSVLNFVNNNYGLINILEEEKYSALLEPLSVATLIEHIEMDSYILKKIYEWGKNYLKMEKGMSSVSSFFKNHKILNNNSLNIFESAGSIFEFHEYTKRSFFSSDEILAYLQINVFENNKDAYANRLHIANRSEWVQIEEGSIIKEHFEFVQPLFSIFKEKLNNNRDNYYLNIETNNVAFYNFPVRNDILNANRKVEGLISCKVYCTWKNDDNHKKYCRRSDRSSAEEDRISKNSITCHNCMIDVKSSRHIYSVNLPVESYYLELVSIDITYMFNSSCRILKTSLDVMAGAVVDDNNLYFTRLVEDHVEDD